MFRSSVRVNQAGFSVAVLAAVFFVSLLPVDHSLRELRAIAQSTQEKPKVRNVALERKKFDKAKYVKRVQSRNAHSVGIITGELSGTYLQFAADMADVLDDMDAQPQVRVVPIVGQGGVQNVLDMLFLKGIDMGIVQQGQLTYLQQTDPVFFKNIKSRIHYVTKLYNSEFHIVARKDFATIKSLKGNKVVTGKRLSSSDVMARSVFNAINLNVDIVNTDLSNGLEMLRNGEVAAVAVLGGAPVRGLADIGADENMHLLSVDYRNVGINNYFNLIESYLPTKISHEHYPNLIGKGEHIPSIASGALLAVYNWAPDSRRYKKLRIFVDRFFDRFDEFLRKPRHPKWQEVSLYAGVPGWTRFAAANNWIARRRSAIGQEVSAGEMKIAMDAFVRQYSKVWKIEQITPLQRDDIWAAIERVFGRWWYKSG